MVSLRAGTLLLAFAQVTTGEGSASERSRVRSFPLISHRQQLNRRRLATTGNTTTVDAPLYQGLGTHYVDLYVGSPKGQRQTLIVDTWSEWTAFPCEKDCCGQHTDEEFDREQSDTFHTRSCSRGECQQQEMRWNEDCAQNERDTCQVNGDISEEYRWTAFEAVDQVSLVPTDQRLNQPHESFPLRFGCQTKTAGSLMRQLLADGIIGMNDHNFSFWRQAGVDSFSLCFSSSYSLEDAAGVMTLGGHDERLLEEELQWVRRVPTKPTRPGFYVAVTDVYFKTGDDDSLTFIEGFNATLANKHGVVLDSGTTDTWFPSALNDVFKEAFDKLTGHEWEHGLLLTLEEVHALPTIVVELGGIVRNVTVEIPPLHYFGPSENDEDKYERILFFDGRGTVLGANFLQGHNVHFAKDRIGIAASSCNYQDLIQPTEEQSHSVKMELAQGNSNDNRRKGRNPGLYLVLVVVAVGGLFFAKKRTHSRKYAVVRTEAAKVEVELT